MVRFLLWVPVLGIDASVNLAASHRERAAMGDFVKIKVDGKNASRHYLLPRNLQDFDIFVYGHHLESIKSYFRHGGERIKMSSGYRAKLNCYCGTYRRAITESTQPYDALDLLQQGWGIGTVSNVAGFTGLPVVDDGISSALEHALFRSRHFVALTTDKYFNPQRGLLPTFVKGQRSIRCFLSKDKSLTFRDIAESLL